MPCASSVEGTPPRGQSPGRKVASCLRAGIAHSGEEQTGTKSNPYVADDMSEATAHQPIDPVVSNTGRSVRPWGWPAFLTALVLAGVAWCAFCVWSTIK